MEIAAIRRGCVITILSLGGVGEGGWVSTEEESSE